MKNRRNKTLINLFFALTCLGSLNGQTALIEQIGFEELKSEIPSGEVWNGSNGKTQYATPDSIFAARLSMDIGWDTAWGGYWKNQWAFSRKNVTTVEPSDYSKHLYAAKPGKGAEEQGEVYAIGTQNTYLLNPDPLNQFIDGFFITNTTFAYNSMALGDDFAKKFTANDKDSFILKVSVFLNGELKKTKHVVLADFRSSDTTKHFLLDTWQYVEMTTESDSIHFEMQSSDVGNFGINTPLYFALDRIVVVHRGSTKKPKNEPITVYPNPAINQLHIVDFAKIRSVDICDYRGGIINSVALQNGTLDISYLNEGIYWVRAHKHDGGIATSTFVKSN